MLNKEDAKKVAEPIVKAVVDCIAEKRYTDIEKYAHFDTISLPDLIEAIESYMEYNELPYIDKCDVPCNFKPHSEYCQFQCYIYKDGSGFKVDYDLTTDKELNDLTLQMGFMYTKSGTLTASLLDIHVMWHLVYRKLYIYYNVVLGGTGNENLKADDFGGRVCLKGYCISCYAIVINGCLSRYGAYFVS